MWGSGERLHSTFSAVQEPWFPLKKKNKRIETGVFIFGVQARKQEGADLIASLLSATMSGPSISGPSNWKKELLRHKGLERKETIGQLLHFPLVFPELIWLAGGVGNEER